jgi:1-acyl-sn-glycerol-3-phosphate acyltransferase
MFIFNLKNEALVKTLVTFISGFVFLCFIFMFIPFVFEKDSIDITQYIFFLSILFFVVLIGLIIPFLRNIKINMDGIATIMIILVSSIPLLLLYFSLRLVLIGKVTKFKYKFFNFAVSAASMLLGVWVIYTGKSNPKGRIQIYNHTGPWDYLGALLALGGSPFNAVAGINLANAKGGTIFDKFLTWTVGFMVKNYSISVDRNDPVSRKNAFEKMKVELGLGKFIGIFPEGGRVSKKEIFEGIILKDFQNGAFKLAWDTKTPIQPVVFDFPATWKAKDDDFWGITPCLIYIRFLSLVDPNNFNSIEEFKKECRDRMEDKLKKSKQLEKFLKN